MGKPEVGQTVLNGLFPVSTAARWRWDTLSLEKAVFAIGSVTWDCPEDIEWLQIDLVQAL